MTRFHHIFSRKKKSEAISTVLESIGLYNSFKKCPPGKVFFYLFILLLGRGVSLLVLSLLSYSFFISSPSTHIGFFYCF